MTRMTTEELRRHLPWPEPKGLYDDDGANCEVEINGHRFVVADTGDYGCDTGRKRWRVTCATCNEEIHRGSTSARAQISRHLSEKKADDLPVHRLLLSQIPEEERPAYVRDGLAPPWASDAGKFRGRDAPFATTVEGYAQWKIDCGDNGNGKYWDGSPRPEHLMNGRPCPESDPTTDKPCTGKTVYAGHYCTRAGCIRSVEAMDLVHAVQRNDLKETLRLVSICFGDSMPLDALAELVDGMKRTPREIR